MNQPDRHPGSAAAGTLRPLMLIGLLFFLFGTVTWLNGSLIPYLKQICRLSTQEALLVTFAFYIAYTVMALPMTAILARTGYRLGMAVGLGLMALAAALHIPAALLASYPLFLLALFTMGSGLTILQTASNPYLVLLGPIESAARRISVMGILNKAAGVVAPLAFTALVLDRLGRAGGGRAGDPQALAHRLVMPYAGMAAVLAALVGLVMLAPLPEVEPAPATTAPGGAGRGLLSHPQLVLGVVALFGYVGVEVIAGDTIGLFGQSLGVQRYSLLTAYTMVGMVAGYCLGIVAVPRWISQRAALAGCGVAGLLAVVGVLLSNPRSQALATALWGWSAVPVVPDPVVFVAAMGLAHALVWPALWPMALRDLGHHTAPASALLVMSISGGAVLPLALGWLGTRLGGLQAAYALALPPYAMILFYAVKGSRMRAWPWAPAAAVRTSRAT